MNELKFSDKVGGDLVISHERFLSAHFSAAFLSAHVEKMNYVFVQFTIFEAQCDSFQATVSQI